MFKAKKQETTRCGVIEKEISYMMTLPKYKENNFSKRVEDFNERIENLNNLNDDRDFDLINIKSKNEDNSYIVVEIEYKKERYEVELILETFSIPEMYTIKHDFNNENYKKLRDSKHGITVGLKFKESNLESYHLQLKILNSIMPESCGIIDFSSEKILSSEWLKLAAESKTPPSPEYIYTIHAVNDEDETVWLHTHGLNRCGSIELEILNSDIENYKSHGDLINCVAKRFIEEPIADEKEGFLISYVQGNVPILGTWMAWDKAIQFYDDNMIGGANDRKGDDNIHTSPSGVIYLYLSKDDYDKCNVTHISAINEIIKDNPIYMFSNDETLRMSLLAIERVLFFKTAILNSDYKGLMKFGMKTNDEYKDKSPIEHLWFEVSEINDYSNIKGILTQEPYFIKEIHANDILNLNIKDLTDWIIYTPETTITPDSVYKLNLL